MTVQVLRPRTRVLRAPPISQVEIGRAQTAPPPPWWYVEGKTCVAAYQPKGAASYTASKINLASPGTYDAVPLGAEPLWDSGGWYNCPGMKVDGFTTVEGHAYSLIIRTNNYSKFALMASVAAWEIYTRDDSWHAFGPWTGNISGGATGDVVMCITSGDGTSQEAGYRNGIMTKTNWTTYSTVGGLACTLFPLRNMTTYAMAAALYSDRLTEEQVATVSAAMAAL